MTAAHADQPLPIAIREGTAADVPFIMDSWLKSYHADIRRSDRVTELNLMRDSDFYEGVRRQANVLLSRDPVRVACSESDPTELYGWVCGYQGTLHYVVVKQAFRGMGIARRLMRSLDLVGDRAPTLYVTHLTRAVLSWRGKGHDVRYDPFRVWR